jgi:DNA-binding PadR family transcriptional regulator
MGRMFGQGDLKLLLLALIETQPRHGYELIRAIEDLCGGSYSPSPGAIYPTLTFLEEAGYATVQMADASAKKQYAITDEGRQYLAQNRPNVEAVMQHLKLSSRMMAKLSVPDTIRESMHQLKHVLMGHDRAWDAAEVKRVIAILQKAATEITSA